MSAPRKIRRRSPRRQSGTCLGRRRPPPEPPPAAGAAERSTPASRRPNWLTRRLLTLHDCQGWRPPELEGQGHCMGNRPNTSRPALSRPPATRALAHTPLAVWRPECRYLGQDAKCIFSRIFSFFAASHTHEVRGHYLIF